MIRCERCHKNVERGELVTLATTDYRFPYRRKAHHFRTSKVRKCRGVCFSVGRNHVHDDPGGVGKQIVREARWCAACLTSRKA
jgi:hypothetical protein